MPIDYKRYPPNWKTEIVPAILYRAGYACEQCDLKNGQIVFAVRLRLQDDDGRYKIRALWFSVYEDALRAANFHASRINEKRVVLTIAHLDHDETNHTVNHDRLKALCQICHLRYDAKEKYRRMLENGKQKMA